jgi:predicted nucleotidyltransferase
MKRALVERHTILLATVGSIAYGLTLPTSDRDIKGICIAPAEYYYGLKQFDQKDKGWDDTTDPSSGLFPVLDGIKDCTIYELKKFLRLAMNNNPTVLEMLWLKDYEYLSTIGRALVDSRHLFLSKKVKHTYTGYAHAQLKKVSTHRSRLLNPPTSRPQAKDYGLDDAHLPVGSANDLPLTKSQMGSFLEYILVLTRDSIEFMEPVAELKKLLLEDIDLTAIVKQRPLTTDVIPYVQALTRGSTDFMQLLQASQAYRKAISEWDNYQQWKTNRNLERAALEAHYGFDSKHAAHSVRLLRHGLEVLLHGTLTVDRRDAGDAPQLLAIRKGEYTYEQVIEITDALFLEVDEAYKLSTLPHGVDQEYIDLLCTQWVRDSLSN